MEYEHLAGMFWGLAIGLILFSWPGYWFRKTIIVDENRVLVTNNLLGQEKVFVNDKQYISKICFAGRHEFLAEGIKFEIEFFIKPHLLGLGITARANGEIIYTEK